MPYTSHNATPSVKMTYMASDMPRVSRVRMVITACGTKEPVVSNAARKPMLSLFMARIVPTIAQTFRRKIDRSRYCACIATAGITRRARVGRGGGRFARHPSRAGRPDPAAGRAGADAPARADAPAEHASHPRRTRRAAPVARADRRGVARRREVEAPAPRHERARGHRFVGPAHV